MKTVLFYFAGMLNKNTATALFLLFTIAANPARIFAQEGPESISYDPNDPSNIVRQWEGPWNNNEGWTYWKGTMANNTATWLFDNNQGERRIGYDLNNDGRYERWQEELTLPGKPALQVYHWDYNQDGTDNTIAWAEAGNWIEKVWDANYDGLFDSWCSYTQPGCVQFIAASDCNLAEQKRAFDAAYKAYLEAQQGNATTQKYYYLLYQREDLIFKICKNINMR
ncbi:hypothetical protein C7N43_19755 [Sphingobacteriales bacterium UPWRP_1]|nr:hypothetical protein B6N25_12990 [Sphingobacteriales bacterium TSM_CSS]PSJ75276.1 hypothetical protein C7N43_19755 [Sphingobacteriales bacterium UPWRP_1]